MVRQELINYFLELENNLKPIEEFSLGEKIGEILNAKEEKITDKEELAEYIAFEFMPHYSNKNTGWGTYHGPMIVWKNDQGQFVEFPSIKQIDEEIINYWRKRANDSKHPIMIFRYADLVFDFEPVVLSKAIDYSMAHKVIDAGLEICANGLDDNLGCKDKLDRSLSLAIKINDENRLLKLKDAVISTEEKYAEDDKPGIWGYAFEWLLLDNNKKISLPDEEKTKLVSDLESRLKRLVSVDDPDPWRVERAVKLLSVYFSRTKDEANLKRVIGELESAFRRNKYANSDGMLISNYLEKLIDFYQEYASFQFAKEAKDRLINELSNLGDRGKFATKEVSTEVMIKNEDIEKYLKFIFGENDSEQLEKIIGKIAVNFILKKKSVADQLTDLSKNHPISYLASHVIASDDGYPVAKFGSIEEDYDKHLLENFSRNLHFHAFFLRLVFEELCKKYTAESVADILLLSPVFRVEDKGYITKLLKAFWDKDYLTTCCLSVPLIEDAIRNLHRINNFTFIKPNGDDGYDVLSLNILLSSGLIKVVFGLLGEDVEYYLRVLLTERIGWNLRNNFAHGINKKLFESEDASGRLIHVLLCLSLIRKSV